MAVCAWNLAGKRETTALNQFFLLVWCHQISCKICKLKGYGVFTANTLITLVCVNVMEYNVVHITRYTLWLIVVLLINIGCVLVCQIMAGKRETTALNQFFLLVWCHQISCKIWYEVVKVNLHAALLYLLWAGSRPLFPFYQPNSKDDLTDIRIRKL
jgi:hypothetical protein